LLETTLISSLETYQEKPQDVKYEALVLLGCCAAQVSKSFPTFLGKNIFHVQEKSVEEFLGFGATSLTNHQFTPHKLPDER
jgi:hypothetical protein